MEMKVLSVLSVLQPFPVPMQVICAPLASFCEFLKTIGSRQSPEPRRAVLQ